MHCAVNAQVSGVVSMLPVVVERVGVLEVQLQRSLAVAKQGLDILADQLVALGALNGRSSPSKNPLAGERWGRREKMGKQLRL